MEKEFEKYCRHIDISNSRRIIDTLSSFGDDKATGNRLAGSEASIRAGKYLFEEFQRTGLKNVTADRFNSAGWTFKGANILYKDEDGQEKRMTLGGYATNFDVEEQPVKVVYANEGRLSDYEVLGDITGKVAIITVCPLDSFWVCYPAYQAYLKGAKAVLVVSKYRVEHENALVTQPPQGPAYIPILAISERDSNILKKLIDKSPYKEVDVKLTAHSYVEPVKASYNIWGEIPGRTDEVIYLMAHYDGYYHSYFDDAAGVSVIIGIAKGIIDSHYKPKKTIRVIAHGAEEWGREDSDYDWSVGAYEQINHMHPEWAKKAFAIINIDGNSPVAKQRDFQIITSSELLEYIKKAIEPIIENSEYNYEVMTSKSTWSEEFVYQRAGIPGIVPRESFTESIYYKNIYHSSLDNKYFPFDYKTYRLEHILYGKILFDFDKTPIRPMDFYQRFHEMRESSDESIVGKSLIRAIEEASFYAAQLSEKIRKIKEEDSDLNFKLYKLFKKTQDSFLRLNWLSIIEFPHENYQKNVNLLTKAIKALENRDIDLEKVVDKYIRPIDFNDLVFDFDRRCYNYFSSRVTHGNQNTWGYNLVKKPNEDLYDVAHSLKSKFHEDFPDVSEEIKLLKKAFKRQRGYLDEIVSQEIYDIKEIIQEIKNISNTLE